MFHPFVNGIFLKLRENLILKPPNNIRAARVKLASRL
jgi:hypothetical protein